MIRLWMILALLLAAYCLVIAVSCGCDDDDDDDDNDDDDDSDEDDDDDEAPPALLTTPVDVDQDGEAELVFMHYDGDFIEGAVRVEMFDAESLDFERTSPEFDADGIYYGRVRDFDADTFAEVLLHTAYGDPDAVSEVRMFDGPSMEVVFSRSHAGGYFGPSVRPDFNNDGTPDVYVTHWNPDGTGNRIAYYDGTDDFTSLWDTGEVADTRVTVFGTQKTIGYHSPADFGTLGQGWLVYRIEDTGLERLHSLSIVNTQGAQVWTDGPFDLGEWGYVDFTVDDYNGDGVDEIAMIQQTDDGIDPPSTVYQVLAPPDFEAIHDSGVLDNFEVALTPMLDFNGDGVRELVVTLADLTDGSFDVRILDGADGFSLLGNRNFSADYLYYSIQFFGDWVAPGTFAPARFGQSASPQFLFLVVFTDGVDNSRQVYRWDPDTSDIQLLDEFENNQLVTLDVADYNADGYSEVTACNMTFIDDGGLGHYEAYCEILAGSELEQVYRSDTYIDVLLAPFFRFDLDFDDVPDPGFFSRALTNEATCFWRVLDGQANYSQKASLSGNGGDTMVPLVDFR